MSLRAVDRSMSCARRATSYLLKYISHSGFGFASTTSSQSMRLLPSQFQAIRWASTAPMPFDKRRVVLGESSDGRMETLEDFEIMEAAFKAAEEAQRLNPRQPTGVANLKLEFSESSDGTIETLSGLQEEPRLAEGIGTGNGERRKLKMVQDAYGWCTESSLGEPESVETATLESGCAITDITERQKRLDPFSFHIFQVINNERESWQSSFEYRPDSGFSMHLMVPKERGCVDSTLSSYWDSVANTHVINFTVGGKTRELSFPPAVNFTDAKAQILSMLEEDTN